MMKPTKKHRGIFLTCFFCIVVVQLLTGYQLYRTAESYNLSVDGKSGWVVKCATVALGMRLICLCLSVLGVLHVRITPWTIASTCTFVGYILCVILRIYFLIRYPKNIFFSILLLLQEVSLNIVCILLSLLFAYHSVYVHSESKVSLEMQDPQKVFAERIVKSVISIIPGVGFFQKKLCKLAKV
ncbi:hypothetical protein WA171_003919, partial [Blastocystis sp. BT1]